LPSADPRRQKTERLLLAAVDGATLAVEAQGADGRCYVSRGPLNPLHADMCARRAEALSKGLQGDGLCRPVDLDNLLFVAGHRRNLSRMRLWPFTHQVHDVETMIRLSWLFIASEMRTGKSKIVVDGAQYLAKAGAIDRVIVITPAPVRDVWADRVLGELAKHLWVGGRQKVVEYHSRSRAWQWGEDGPPALTWYVTNFEYLRSEVACEALASVCGPKTLIVGDESSFIKSHSAQQTKAFMGLRKKCGRVVLLNGTPIFHSPLDLFSQGNVLHPSILDCKFVTGFKAKYAIQAPVRREGGELLMSPWPEKQADGSMRLVPIQEITGWTREGLEDLQRRFEPCTVRRLQADCLDLPPKLDPVTLTATLKPEEWAAYKAMRDDMVVWLKAGGVASSPTAGVKFMRLSQITSGFLGGVGEEPPDDDWSEPGEEPELDPELAAMVTGMPARLPFAGPERSGGVVVDGIAEIGRAKLDVLLWFIGERFGADPSLHLVVWCRFRAELVRIMREVAKAFPQFEMGEIWGRQPRKARLWALALLKPETSPTGPVFVAGIEGTGSFGLDFTAAHTCVTMSSGYSPGRSWQTLDRVYGPGQTEPIAYFNVMAVGPRGQKTVDHRILAARLAGENVATWTSAAWVKALEEE